MGGTVGAHLDPCSCNCGCLEGNSVDMVVSQKCSDDGVRPEKPVVPSHLPEKVVSKPAEMPKRQIPQALDDSALSSGPAHIDCKDLAALLEDVLIIDLRSADFFGGHLPGALQLPFEDVLQNPQILLEKAQSLKLIPGNEGKSKLVMCCMDGGLRSQTCAELMSADQLDQLLQDDTALQHNTTSVDMLEVGFLTGGMHAWVNYFGQQSTDNELLKSRVINFEPTAWKTGDGDLFYHVAATQEEDVLCGWRSLTDLSMVLDNAKPLLVHSHMATLLAVEEVARWQQRQLNASCRGLMSPEDFQICHDEVLGRGASSVVVKAKHSTSGGMLAVKMVSIEDVGHRSQVFSSMSFFAGQANRGCFEGLVQLRTVFVEHERVCFVLDYMDLGPISNLLKMQARASSSRGLPEAILRHTMGQVARGLQALHSLHWMHRDIKPDNLLVRSRGGEVRIADFGISRYQQPGADPEHRQRAVSFVGTAMYLSPQRSKGNPYSSKEDVWAFGIVLFEFAIGSMPFGWLEDSKHSSAAEFFGSLWEKMEGESGETAGLTLPDDSVASEELRDVVARCLKKRPSKRLSADDLVSHNFWSLMDADKCKSAWQRWYSEVQGLTEQHDAR